MVDFGQPAINMRGSVMNLAKLFDIIQAHNDSLTSLAAAFNLGVEDFTRKLELDALTSADMNLIRARYSLSCTDATILFFGGANIEN